MRVLIGTEWVDGFLDESLTAGTYRLQPLLWVRLRSVDGLYFVRPGSPGLVGSYVRQFGSVETARKIASRHRERTRNERFVSAGLARVISSHVDGGLQPGSLVAFVAPRHPACMERVVLHHSLVCAWPSESTFRPLTYRATPLTPPPILDDISIGWSPLSGLTFPAGELATTASWLVGETTAHSQSDRALAVGSPTAETSTEHHSPKRADKPSAILFGYGNYAKTQIIPKVRRHLDIRRVHELDPTQIGPKGTDRWVWDSLPVARNDDSYDVALIAGYHHTHAPIALEAMKAGQVAVIEKPLATTEPDGEALVEQVAMGGHLFPCYQRRYAHFNDWLREDLGIAQGAPLAYITTVFEEALPHRHWYGWPTSRSRIVTNGCHWLDHFLWLNDFAEVIDLGVHQARIDLTAVYVELSNGSTLTMTMTSEGASRHGMREYTEIRGGGAVARIVDGASYESENARRILRQTRVNRLRSYSAMYSSICQSIRAGAPSEGHEQLAKTLRLTLSLDGEVTAARDRLTR